MTPAILLEDLRARGVRVEARGQRLQVWGPKEVLTPSLRALLVEQKPALLRLLAAPTPALSAPSHGLAELCGVLGLPLRDLDAVLRVAVAWLDVPLWFVPTEADAEALVAPGKATRGAVWTRRELLDLLGVPGLTNGRARTVALAKLAIEGAVVEVRSVGPSTCHACRGRLWWRSTAGRTVCRICHPPAPGVEADPECGTEGPAQSP